MIVFLICAAAAIAFVCFALSYQTDECPRMIRGYNCREGCDHSMIEVEKAKRDMGYYDDRY